MFLRLSTFLTIIFSGTLLAGITDFYFEKSGISCLSNGARLSESISATNQQLIGCFSDKSLTSSEIESFSESTRELRKNLELWLYTQNAIEKMRENLSLNLSQNRKFQKELKNKDPSPQLARIEEKYHLLHSLYEEKERISNEEKVCSNWRFWNVPERIINNDIDCSFVKANEGLLDELTNSIEEIESLYPQFVHPNLQKDLKTKPKKSFSDSYLPYLSKANQTIRLKEAKFKQLNELDLTKENLDMILNDKALIMAINAVNYVPKTYFVGSTEDSRIASLSIAHCHLSQKQNANIIDKTLREFATDVALVVSPFALKGKLTTVMNATKALNTASSAQKARGAFVLAEGAYIAVENSKLAQADAQCQEIQKIASQQIKLSKSLQKDIKDCFELMDDLATSRVMAVLGGAVAVRLSKFDIQDLRKARILARGKEKLQESMSAVSATMVKQSDLILETLETMLPETHPQMATAGPDLSSPQFMKSQSNTQSGTKTAGKNKKKSAANKMDPERVADINKRVDDYISKLDCFKDKSCKTKILYLIPGIKKLAQGPKGLYLAEEFINLFKGQGFENLAPDIQDILTDCIKVKNKNLNCSPQQFEAIFAMMDHPFKTRPHPYFYQQVLESIRLDASSDNFIRTLSFLTEKNVRPGSGKFSGRTDEAEIINNTLFLNGRRARNQDEKINAISLIREERAARKLAELGYDVKLLEDSFKARKADETQKLFLDLQKAEKIGRNKNPDLIINNEFIADIYSPLRALSEKEVNLVKNRVLTKSEGTNFKDDLLNNYGKRQSNRVVIYVDEVDGDIEKIAEQIRQAIAREKPQHLQEAFILFDKGEDLPPEQLGVWP